MKKRILSIITTLAMVLPMLCAFNIVKPLSAKAESSTPVAQANGITYYSFDRAWGEAVKSGGTFKLLASWRPSSKEFETDEDDYEDYFRNGALCIPENQIVTIDLNGYCISRNLYHGSGNSPTSNGEVIYLSKDASLTIKDTSPSGGGRIEDGNSSNGGGGIHAKPGSRIYMYGGSIAYCYSDSTFIHSGDGGGVYLESGAKMYMYGGKLHNNIAYGRVVGGYGGAVYVDKDARFYMYGGEISYNKACYLGCAVYINDKGYGYFYGGIIKSNSSVYEVTYSSTLGRYGHMYIDGVEITDNKTAYVIQNGVHATCYMRSGSVHDNLGIGIKSVDNSTIYCGGDIKVYNHKYYDGVSRGMNGAGYFGHFSFEEFKDDAKIGIYTFGSVAMSEIENSGQYAKYFFSDRDDYRIVNGSDGLLYAKKTSEAGEDSFITGVTSVKSGDTDIEYNADVTNSSRTVTIHVPVNTLDTTIENLAVTFTATGTVESVTASDTPANGSVQDFTRPVIYTLLNSDERTEQNWSVEVVKDKDASKHTLTVNNSTGSGEYEDYSSVTVSANEVENKRFTSWTAEGITLSKEQISSPSITFTMPANDVTLTANYEDLTSTVELIVDAPYGGKALDAYAAVKVSDGTEGEVPVSWSPMVNEAAFNSTYNAVITFTSEYGFSSNLAVTLNGETVTPKKPDAKTIVITKEFTTGSPKLVSVPQAELTGVKNGTPLDNIALPSKVRIVTEDKSISTADVVWNMNTTGYDPNKTEEQTFTVDGTITPPEGIDTTGTSLTAQIKVTVSASGIAAVPTSNLVNGAVYNTSQTLELTSADGAVIYYTTDGTEPTTASKKYEGAITLAADSKTDKVYAIKAIAVDASSNKSAAAEFKFTVLAPTYKVTIKSGERTAGLGGGTYHAGDSVTVQTASMATGYVFAGWKATGMELNQTQKTSPSFTFTMPENDVVLTPSYLYTITNIALAIDKPTKDSNLDTSAGYTLTGSDNSTQISETEGLTVVWTPVDTQAKGNTEYTAIVVLKPNYSRGFVFDDSVRATVDGASSTTCSKSDDGSITVYAVFPKTDKVKLKSITAPDEMYLNDLTYSYNELMSILPKSVDIATDDGKTRTAGVYWDISPMMKLFFNYGFGSYDSKQLTGSVVLPDDVDANGITSTTTITLNRHAVSGSAGIPIPDITPGAYSENQELNFNTVFGYVKEIRYTTDGSEPSETNGTVYSSDAPIALNGTAGERKTITVKVMAVASNGYNNSAVQAYKYTIDLPAERETVKVTNGIGSGEYNNGDQIGIIAQPESGKVFKNWIAEAVTYTTTEREVTETILDENGNLKEVTTTKTETTRNARAIDGCFAEPSKPVTAFTVPNVNSGEIIEVTAQCADSVTAVNLKAAIPSCGELMPTAITTGAVGVTVNNFAVTPSDAKAKADTQYTMTATLTAKDGYVFGENPVFTVNGTTAAGTPIIDKDANNNVVITGYTVTYTFRTEIPTQNIELDMANGKAYITADKEYTNPVVLFAAYNDDEFVCVSFIYKDLDAGINEINIPDDFSVENANTVKVMVWNNLEDIVPLFEAYEKIKS